MIVLLFQGARKYMENQDAPEIQLPHVYLDRHAFHFWAVIYFGVLRPEAFFDRKQPGYKSPDSLVEPEKSSESWSRTPGFICGVAFFNSSIL